MIWTFEVAYTTHQYLRYGVKEIGWSTVSVWAPSYHEAWKTASWMVINRTGFYVTRTTLLDIDIPGVHPSLK